MSETLVRYREQRDCDYARNFIVYRILTIVRHRAALFDGYSVRTK